MQELRLTDACYFVERRVLSRPGVSPYAEWMFHGLASRRGASYSGLQYRYGDKLRHALCLTKNVYNMAEIFKPDGSWVVSAGVKEKLQGFPGCAFLKVKFEKVFEVAYRLDEELGYYPEDEEDLFDEYEHEGNLVESLGDWYELILDYHDRIVGRFKDNVREYSIKRELTSSPLKVRLSPPMFEEYPLFWEGGVFMREDVFSLVGSSIDRNFFHCQRIPLKD